MSSFPLVDCTQIISAAGNRYLVVCLSTSEYSSYSSSKGFGLIPAAIGKRRIIRSRRSKMPLLISSIKSGTMSARRIRSISSIRLRGTLMKQRDSKLDISRGRAYLTTITTAGGQPITIYTWRCKEVEMRKWESLVKPNISAT